MKHKSPISQKKRPRASKGWLAAVCVLVVLLMVGAGLQAVAQSSEEVWTTPANLSHSGAASSPAIVAQPDGSQRVFWWDRVDGVTMAEGTTPQEPSSPDSPTEWSDPVPTPILVPKALLGLVPTEEESPFTPVAAMPRIVGDAAGRAHAFWLDQASGETGARPLLYARLTPDSTTWSTARIVAESATAFDVATDPSGTIHLSTIRDLNTDRFPAGVYYRRSGDGGASWQAPATVYLSRYLRNLSPEDTFLYLAADDAGGIYVTWDDPQLEGVLLSASLDGGTTWEAPTPVGASAQASEGRPQHGTIVPVPAEETLLLWEILRPNGSCELYQAPIQDVLADGGESGQQVLPDWTTCSPGALTTRKQVLPLGTGRVLLAEERADGFVLLATWDGSSWQRSRPLAFRFDDPELGGRVQLSDLQLALNSAPSAEGEEPIQALAAVGTDEKGEVWITGGQREALEPVLAPVTPTPIPTPRLRLPGTAGEDVEIPPPQPANLSRSGAASSPVIVAGPDSTLRAFWWDSFDGLMLADGAVLFSSVLSGTQTVSGTLDIWSDAVQAPILLAKKVEAGPVGDELSGGQTTLTPIDVMPHIVGDAAGRSHALWLQKKGEGPGTGQLMYSTLESSSIFWSPVDVLAESAAAFAMTDAGDHTLHLVYLRTEYTGDAASGVYHRRSDDGGATWSAPAAIHTSRYYRLISPETTHLRLAADGAGSVYVTWDDPRLEQALLAGSSDAGTTWSKPTSIGAPDGRSQRGRLFVAQSAAEDEVWLLWEDLRYGGSCPLYQALAGEVMGGTEGAGQRVLEELTACPQGEHFAPLGAGSVLMVSGGGSDLLTLAAWDGEGWSVPRQLSYRFENPETDGQVYLGALQAALALVDGSIDSSGEERRMDEALVVVGADSEGDVWVSPAQMDALEVVFEPPSPWSAPVNVSQGLLRQSSGGSRSAPSVPGNPALAADAEGRIYALWAESEASGKAGTGLLCARWDGTNWTRATTVLQSPEGSAKEPSLVVAADRLHALWSGGPTGQIWYSRAFLQDAHAAGGWSGPRPLPDSDDSTTFQVGSWPHMIASGGTLYAVYAVPVNEGRGIYSLRSDDDGENWSPPRQVFDALEAGWAAVDYPRLAVDGDRGLHVVWVHASVSEGEPSQGIYYAHSDDGGEMWSEPLELAQGAVDWPRVAVSEPGRVHVLWHDASDSGTWWHRWAVMNAPQQAEGGARSRARGGSSESAWSQAERVPGQRGVTAPAGFVADGAGLLYLIGLVDDDEGEPALLSMVWEDERWGQQEMHLLDPAPGEPGVAVALQPALGHLDVTFRGELQVGDEAPQKDLWHTGRAVPTAVVTRATPSVPQETPMPTPTATTGPIPTATPDWSVEPPPSSGGSASLPLPLLLAGGLAGLIVLGVLARRFLWAGRR